MSKYTKADLEETFEQKTLQAIAHCEYVSDMAGSQPAEENSVRQFVIHHYLKISPEEANNRTDEINAIVKRILKEEVGDRDNTKDTDELKEVESYGVNIVRRDEIGYYIGHWMVKAAIKTAASRLDLFRAKGKIGVKGDLAECGRINAFGHSLKGDNKKIYLYNKDGNIITNSTYVRLLGRVNTPSGARSISKDVECISKGARFSFELRALNTRLTESDVKTIFAFLGIVGIGAARSLEYSKFDIIECSICENKK